MPDALLAPPLSSPGTLADDLRRRGYRGRTVGIKLRFADFRTVTRARTLEAATDRTDLLRAAAREVFREFAAAGYRPLRLVGFTATRLERGAVPGGQLDLFAGTDPAHARKSRLDRAADAIRARFGAGAIGHADAARRPAADTLPSWNSSTPST